jgi:hypothetical protein
MSPEQAKCEAVDQRSDLFALGSTLYAMCTGVAPFRGSPCLAVLKQVCEGEPEPIRVLNPSIPAWLEGIIRKLQAKEPDQRFFSAAEVADLLEQCLAHVQHADCHPLPVEAAQLVPPKPRQYPRRLLRWIASAALAMAAVVGYVFWPEGRKAVVATPNTAEAALPPADAETLPLYDEPLLAESQAIQARFDRLRQSFLGAAGDGNPLEAELRRVRQQLDLLEQAFKQPAPAESDPVASHFAALRAALVRLQQSVDFSQNTSSHRSHEGEYP